MKLSKENSSIQLTLYIKNEDEIFNDHYFDSTGFQCQWATGT